VLRDASFEWLAVLSGADRSLDELAESDADARLTRDRNCARGALEGNTGFTDPTARSSSRSPTPLLAHVQLSRLLADFDRSAEQPRAASAPAR